MVHWFVRTDNFPQALVEINRKASVEPIKYSYLVQYIM